MLPMPVRNNVVFYYGKNFLDRLNGTNIVRYCCESGKFMARFAVSASAISIFPVHLLRSLDIKNWEQ